MLFVFQSASVPVFFFFFFFLSLCVLFVFFMPGCVYVCYSLCLRFR